MFPLLFCVVFLIVTIFFYKEDVSKQELKEKNTKEKKQPPIADVVPPPPPVKLAKKHPKQSVTNPIPAVTSVGNETVMEKEIEEKPVQPVLTTLVSNGIIGNPGKEKKKKKSEYNTMQQMSKLSFVL